MSLEYDGDFFEEGASISASMKGRGVKMRTSTEEEEDARVRCPTKQIHD